LDDKKQEKAELKQMWHLEARKFTDRNLGPFAIDSANGGEIICMDDLNLHELAVRQSRKLPY